MYGQSATSVRRHHVKIGGLSCSFCSETIKKAFSQVQGVKRVSVSLAHEEVMIEFDPRVIDSPELEKILENLGYTVRDLDKMRSFEDEERELTKEKRRLKYAGTLVGISVFLMVVMKAGVQGYYPIYLMIATALTMVFVLGRPILKMAYFSLKRGILNQHVLMEFSAFGGLTGGFLGFIFPEFPKMDFFAVSVFVTGYHILSGYVSLRVRMKSSEAVRRLLQMQARKARVVIEGEERVIPIESVKKGALVRIKPGETVPVDGTVVEGESAIDESIVTGESIPVEKSKGGEVISGSINLTGALLVKVSRVGEESFLYRIAQHVEEARALKPGVLQLVDKILMYYVPFVLIFAALSVAIWTLGMWLFMEMFDFKRAIFAGLAALVMGYPCALGMATPLAMIRGGGEAATKGILMRSGEVFQIFKDVQKIILDKTGTLTTGRPHIMEIITLNGKEGDLMAIAASLEQYSGHPLAKAIVEDSREKGISLKQVEKFSSLSGFGVEGIAGGLPVLVGNIELMIKRGIDITSAKNAIDKLENKGMSIALVAINKRLTGIIGLGDTLKEDVYETIEDMKRAGMDPIMVTGDNERAAKAIAKKAGIDEVIAGVLPEEKAEHIRELQKKGFRVAMVGDGINDAPALTQADVGIAFATGTDISIESADIIITGNRLGAIMDAYHIAKTSYRKTKQNLALAFSFNGLGVPLSITGLVHPVWAMMAMAASVSVVLLNSFGVRLIPPIRKKRATKKVTTSEELEILVPTMHCEGVLRLSKMRFLK
jgi:heavy metal translocating P-type ATPase